GREWGPGLPAGHDEGPECGRPREGAGRERAEGPPRARYLPPAGTGEAGGGPLLLREPDTARDRRGARSHGVARVAAPHEGGPAPQGPPSERGRVDNPEFCLGAKFGSAEDARRFCLAAKPGSAEGRFRKRDRVSALK